MGLKLSDLDHPLPTSVSRMSTICSADIVPVLIILHMSSIEDTLKPNWLATRFTKLVCSVALRSWNPWDVIRCNYAIRFK